MPKMYLLSRTVFRVYEEKYRFACVNLSIAFNPTFKLPDKRHILPRKTTPQSQTAMTRLLLRRLRSGVVPLLMFLAYFEGVA